jgi:23S rRNA pseudouridine1911/1915/1917 synthase
VRLLVEPGEGGRRLDVALVAALDLVGAPLSRTALSRVFAVGEVVDDAGRPLKAARALAEPLWVTLPLPRPPPLVHAFPEPIPLAVVHEDEDVLVVDKPAGMVVHAGPGHRAGTLVNAVLHHLGVAPQALPAFAGTEGVRPGIVHRIDRDTTGLVVVAKTARAQECLAGQFATHAIERSYVGLVAGVPGFSTRTIETQHGRASHDRRRFAVLASGGRRAVTRIEVVEAMAGAAMAVFTLETGRTHQIRVHTHHLGHPILGDALYGRTPAPLRELLAGVPGHALHARELGFSHPAGHRVHLRAEPPAPFLALAAALRGL